MDSDLKLNLNLNQCDGCRRGLPITDGIHHGKGWDIIGCTADRYGDSDMAERGCNFCSSDATTERTNLALCNRCAKVWDTATMAEENRAAAEVRTAAGGPNKHREETQLQTLFEAIRYLVRNTLPEELSDSGLQIRLIEELDAIVASGIE